MNGQRSRTPGGIAAIVRTVNDPARSIPTLSRDAARELDRIALIEYGIPGIVLMENAARAVAVTALGLTGGQCGKVLIACGPGNNGGDGFAAARHLHNAGARVAIACCAEPSRIRGDALTNLAIVERMALPMRTATGASMAAAFDECVRMCGAQGPDLILDALFGTGLARAIDDDFGTLVARIADLRARGAKVLAVDIPSGLDADTGQPLGPTVRADVTVTFGAWKTGFMARGAPAFTGRIEVGDLGVPRELTARLARPAAAP